MTGLMLLLLVEESVEVVVDEEDEDEDEEDAEEADEEGAAEVVAGVVVNKSWAGCESLRLSVLIWELATVAGMSVGNADNEIIFEPFVMSCALLNS